MFDEIWLKFWMLSGAKACTSCRSRQELSNEYLLAKFGHDTAENGVFARLRVVLAATSCKQGSTAKPRSWPSWKRERRWQRKVRTAQRSSAAECSSVFWWKNKWIFYFIHALIVTIFLQYFCLPWSMFIFIFQMCLCFRKFDVFYFALQQFLTSRALRCCGRFCECPSAGASSGDALIPASAVHLQPQMCTRNLWRHSGITSYTSRHQSSFSWSFDRGPFSLNY